MSEYELVSRGKLKLKDDSDIKKKKKKKNKDKDKERIEKIIAEGVSNAGASTSSSTGSASGGGGRHLTDAEKKFKQMQEKMKNKKILEKAGMTHKQRVEKFNEHLDSLTEHFDIPKVSWTK